MAAEAGAPGALTAESDAGGSQPQEDLTPSEHEDSGRPVAGTAPDAASDDDDTEEDDFSDVPFHNHPRFKALAKRNAKLRRQLARIRPVAERVKGVDLDTLSVRARVAENIEQILAKRPDLRQSLMEAMAGGGPPERAAEKVPEFDPATLPFDINDDVGKYFVAQHQRQLALERQLQQLLGDTNASKKEREDTARKSYETQWKSVAEAAAKQLPKNVQNWFLDTIYGAYITAIFNGKSPNPQQFVDKYVAGLYEAKAITSNSALRSSDAAAQRIAENNKSLPRRPAGGGAPTTARDGRKELVADVSRRLKRQFGA